GDASTLDIDVARKAGNPQQIALPTDKGDPVAKTKTILDKKATLTANDPADNQLSQKKMKAHMKEFTVDMVAGRTYQIEVKSTAFDPFIRVGGPNGMQVAQGNDRVSYRATVNGTFRIHAIARNHKLGAFHVTVVENP